MSYSCMIDCSNWRICASKITSNAVVGSSAMRRAGLNRRHSAIMMRWRIPPLSSWGYMFIRSAGTRTSARTFKARFTAASGLTFGSCAWMVSMKWSRIRINGFKRVIGSWKIIAILRPRRSRISFGERLDRSMPSNRTVPEIRAFSGSRRRMARPSVLFPHPLSPTSPTVVPFSIVRSTSVTA